MGPGGAVVEAGARRVIARTELVLETGEEDWIAPRVSGRPCDSQKGTHLRQDLRQSCDHGSMAPRDVVERWVELFNAGDAEAIAGLYSEDAVNHQVAEQPVEGRAAIRAMFAREFADADMKCIPEVIHEAGEVAILEWRDPLGLRGCGFFTVRDGLIEFQRGYWDKLSFLRLQGLPVPSS